MEQYILRYETPGEQHRKKEEPDINRPRLEVGGFLRQRVGGEYYKQYIDYAPKRYALKRDYQGVPKHFSGKYPSIGAYIKPYRPQLNVICRYCRVVAERYSDYINKRQQA